ncbi:sn-glycerol-3-phosphate ABC transporter permease UgpA [Aureimonas frigidaquae]|uniref:sn-glycerol-3-phosphate transport system permease protein UgpA n=1 Tax=Aureimonas frigidaquae TaxID=424757 RepID=A0A0P0Z0D4_9HYPH|nr:sn-glycerol-3-phosphate ABC transporter permease UgpA [Aureimonas frigidaquae]BAT27339.1 sn-glycerol-3-phosphate ABC transporter permease [Aureimonas frigidaquae]
MAEKRVTFGGTALPILLLAPQLAITAIFFFWPAIQAVRQSLYRSDAFGFGERFVGGANFSQLFASSRYWESVQVTFLFAAAVCAITLCVALAFAAAVDRLIRSRTTYSTLLIWPYAVAPAVAGILWWFLFNPSIGILAYGLRGLGVNWNHFTDGGQALLLTIVAASWAQVSYNFIFFLAGLQSIPRSLIEAAAIDGASPAKRFFTITLPLLSPTIFFLSVVNMVYAFFDTFGIIDTTTEGGPGRQTTTLVYQAYTDGFLGQNFGSSAAQSVILTMVVILLTVIQFRFVERRVHY